MHSEGLTQHVHSAGGVHDHAGATLPAASGGGHHSTTLNDRPIPEKAPHSPDGQCCGLMYVTALPATLIDIVKPSAPMARCELEGYRKVSDNAASRLYRPPIS